MDGPPSYGTLLELMCLMVWRSRQVQMVASVRAQAQAAIGGEKAVEAFSDFQNLVNQVENEDRAQKMREQLEALKEIKEIRFKPLISEHKRAGPALRTVRRESIMPTVDSEHQLRPVTAKPKRQRKRDATDRIR